MTMTKKKQQFSSHTPVHVLGSSGASCVLQGWLVHTYALIQAKAITSVTGGHSVGWTVSQRVK